MTTKNLMFEIALTGVKGLKKLLLLLHMHVVIVGKIRRVTLLPICGASLRVCVCI